MHIRDYLFSHRNSDRIAVICGDKQVSYRELHNSSMSLSKELNKFENSRIGIYIGNQIEYLVSYFAVLYSGKTIVPMSVTNKAKKAIGEFSSVGVSVILTTHEFLDVFNQEGSGFKAIAVDYIAPSVEYSEYMIEPVNDIAMLVSTSATTSSPKRVILTDYNITSLVETLIPIVSYSEQSISLVVLPMTSIFMNCHILQMIKLGAKLVIMRGFFTVEAMLKLVNKERVTCFTCSPTTIAIMARSNLEKKYDTSSLNSIVIGGAHMSAQILEKVAVKYPEVCFGVGYGLTETSAAVACNTFSGTSIHRESVGKPLPGIKVSIIKDGAEVGPDEIGEIVIESDTVMQGYLNNEEATRLVVSNGKLFTGDLGKLDQDGYLYVVGRKKSMINTGGLSVFPEEIEEILITHPSILDAKVFGEDDPLLEERIVAQVVVKDTISEKMIKEYCKSHVSLCKVPKRIYFVDKIQKTATGKVIRGGCDDYDSNDR